MNFALGCLFGLLFSAAFICLATLYVRHGLPKRRVKTKPETAPQTTSAPDPPILLRSDASWGENSTSAAEPETVSTSNGSRF